MDHLFIEVLVLMSPTSDHGMKPNVVAYGDVMTASKKGISQSKGTSFSCPLIAGFAACLWEMFPNYSNMQIFKLIEKSSIVSLFWLCSWLWNSSSILFFKKNNTRTNIKKIIEDKETDTK